MIRRPTVALLTCCVAAASLALSFCNQAPLDAASKKKPVIRNPKFDPNAEQVEFFSAMEAGKVEAKLIPKDAMGGTIFVENKTDKPLNVQFPEAMIGVNINAQFGGGGFGGQQGGQQGGFGGGGGQQGGQQQQGGGVGGGQQGGFGGGGGGFGGGGQQGGGGFFSIPPEKVVALPFNSVCMNHGKPEPNARSTYRLVSFSSMSQDPVLYELLAQVGKGNIDAQAAQAAAWTKTDNMTWDQLAAKQMTHLGGRAPTPYFSQAQLATAQRMLVQAAALAEEHKTKEKLTTPVRSTATTASASTESSAVSATQKN